LGFEPIREDVPTLQEQLHAAGYLNGILGKSGHLAPEKKFCWDVNVSTEDTGGGRTPSRFYKHAKAFLEKARTEGKPFSLMANIQDPHRPFPLGDTKPNEMSGPGGKGARRKGMAAIPVSRTFKPSEVDVPGFMPDLPGIRKEIAQFYAAIHRCDESVGEILRALHETGYDDSTMVMFISDNGMPFPFAKTNCYKFSTHTPWFVRLPGKIKANSINDTDFISGIDYTPTVLDAAGLPPLAGVDGRSFLPLLRGEKQEGRESLLTVFHQTAGKNNFPMRAVQDRRYGYIFNAWADGKTKFKNESRGTASFKAMEDAAKTDAKASERVKMFLYRAKEEFYDYDTDPNALHNLIDDPGQKERVAKFRAEMLQKLKTLNDPLLADFEKAVKKQD
jgi:N-sulfoglucosamine sulfohydrolase